MGTTIAAVLLWLFFKDTDWGAAWAALEHGSLSLMALGLLLQLCGTALRTTRWHALLRSLGSPMPWRRAWHGYIAGLGIGTLIAGGLASLSRALMATQPGPPRLTAALTLVVAEHVFDLLAVIGLFSMAIFAPSILGTTAAPTAGASSAAATIASACYPLGALALLAGTAVVVARRPGTMPGLLVLLGRLPRGLEARLHEAAEAFTTTVSRRAGPGGPALLAATTLGAWATMAAGTHTYLRAFDLHVSPLNAAWLTAAIALGAFLPTPGGVGTYHATALLVLGELWGFNATHHGGVVAFAVVSHLGFTLVVLALTPFSLWREGASLARLLRGPAHFGPEEVQP